MVLSKILSWLNRNGSTLMSFSVKLSVLLEECNIVKLKPRFKKGSKSDPQRYRPISPLPPVSKVTEK